MTDSDKKRFAAAMVALYKAFGKPIDIDITRICYLALQGYTIEDAEKCIEYAILNSDRFPTPHQLKEYHGCIPRKPTPRIEHKSQHNPKLAEHANKLIQGALAGKLTEAQLIEGMMILEREYPNIGWQTEAAKLASYYRQRDMEKAG